MESVSVMKDITICILAHQKNAVISEVLAAVSWAEHLLIMDNESGIEWSREYGITEEKLTVISVPGKVRDFAALRNEALACCNTPWIFFIDSDEVLSAGAELELHRVLHSGAQAGIIQRSDVFNGVVLKNGEAGNQQLVRICHVASTQFVGTVHEEARVNGRVIETSITLRHFAHSSVSSFITAVNEYAQLVALQERFTQIGRTSLLLQLLFFPILKFMRNYLLLGGVSDGYAGLVYASCMSLHSLLVRIYVYEQRFISPTTKE